LIAGVREIFRKRGRCYEPASHEALSADIHEQLEKGHEIAYDAIATDHG
jgi:hypothetical protein